MVVDRAELKFSKWSRASRLVGYDYDECSGFVSSYLTRNAGEAGYSHFFQTPLAPPTGDTGTYGTG